MEEVGHEGDLGDGQPEVPGEEVVDNPPVAATASEGHPHQTESPASLTESVVRSALEFVPEIVALKMEFSE